MARALGCLTHVVFYIWIFVSIIGGSMGEKKPTYTVKELENMALEYMDEKYGENDDRFTAYYSTWDSKEFEVWMHSDKYEEAEIRVYWNFEEEKFTDNYIAYVLKEEVEEKFNEIFAAVYGEENFKLEYEPNIAFGVGVEFGLGMTVEEFLDEMDSVNLYVVCIGNPYEKEEKMQEVFEILSEKGWGMDCRFVYVDVNEVEDWKDVSADVIVHFKKYICFADIYQEVGRGLPNYKWKERGKNGF